MDYTEIPGFTAAPNRFDVRIECDSCHVSWTGSTAYAAARDHARKREERRFALLLTMGLRHGAAAQR